MKGNNFVFVSFGLKVILRSSYNFKLSLLKLINPIDNFNKLMKLNGYEYTNKITKKKDKGVIAQQVENISPDLVDNQDRYKGVKYDNIIPMLIEGIKYQQKEINILKSKLK